MRVNERESMSRKLIYIYKKLYREDEGDIKIGDTSIDKANEDLRDNSSYLERMAENRIRVFERTSKIEILYCTLAVDDDYKSFRDHDVHNVLTRSGYKKFTKGLSREWFHIPLNVGIEAINAVKRGDSCLNSNSLEFKKEKIKLRDEQKDALDQTVSVFKTKKDMLWNAKMRFGKTITALELIKTNKYKKSLIITHRPIVTEGWLNDFNKVFDEDDNYLFFSKNFGGKPEGIIEKGQTSSIVCFASIQKLRESTSKGKYSGNDEEIFATDWDLIVVDEAHEGTKTDLATTLMDELITEKTKVLKMSGTPFNLIDDYNESQIYTWDYIMEQEAKKEWDLVREGDSNPYSEMPKMLMYVYELKDIIRHDVFRDIENKSFNFTEFFRVVDEEFVYYDEIWNFLNIISNINNRNNEKNMPFANEKFRNELRHTLWTIPSRISGQLLEKMLNKHPVFKKYNIANLTDNNNDKDMDEIRSAITDTPEDSFSITLTVRKGTVGTTVEEWTGILVLNNTESASNYLQSIFRVQNSYSGKNGFKENAYVFDFAPDRTLKMVSEAANLNVRGGGLNSEKQEESMKKLLNFMPIIGVTGSSMKSYSVTSMLTQLKRAQALRAVLKGFDDSSIYSDELLKLDSIDLHMFDKLRKKIGITQQTQIPREIEVNKQGLSNEELEKAEAGSKKPPRERSLEEKEAMNKRKQLADQRRALISILRGISIRIPLMIYGMNIDLTEDITIDNFIELVDEESWKEFMPENITKKDFVSFNKYYDSEIFLEAGRRIRASSKAADLLSPEARIEKITSLFSGFKNPDKETVLTPWRVVNMHLGSTIGGYNFCDETNPFTSNGTSDNRYIDFGEITENIFRKDVKILEVNSKTGLYPLYMAYTIYKKRFDEESHSWSKLEWIKNDKRLWRDVIESCIYVINKTPMAKTITYRTLVGYDHYEKVLDNLIVIDDMADRLNEDVDDVIRRIYLKLGEEDMKFDAIVGNPPYMEKRGNYNLQIHFDFLRMSYLLSDRYVSLIQPLNWLNDPSTLNLVSQNLIELHRFSDSTDVFTEVSIPSGVGFNLIDKHKTVNKTKVFEKGNSRNFKVTGNYNIDDIRIKEEVLFDKSIFDRISTYVGHENKDKSLNEDLNGDIQIWYKKEKGKAGRNEWFTINRKSIPNSKIIDMYKVMISKDGHAEKSDTKPENIFNNRAIVLKPNQISTDRPYLIEATDEEEAILIAKYANSKFFRRLLHIQNKASSVPKSAFMDVPDINEWKDKYIAESWVSIDEFLNDHFNLTEETILDINRRIAVK